MSDKYRLLWKYLKENIEMIKGMTFDKESIQTLNAVLTMMNNMEGKTK